MYLCLSESALVVSACLHICVQSNHIELQCRSQADYTAFMFCFSAVISPASWREGQKLVKMVLGPVPKLPREDRPQPTDGVSRTGGT